MPGAFYDEKMRFVVEPGEFRLAVGPSAAEAHQGQVVELSGEVACYPQRSVVAVRSTVSPAR